MLWGRWKGMKSVRSVGQRKEIMLPRTLGNEIIIIIKRIVAYHETFAPLALEMGKSAKKSKRALPRGMLKNLRICLPFSRGTWHETLNHLYVQLHCSEFWCEHHAAEHDCRLVSKGIPHSPSKNQPRRELQWHPIPIELQTGNAWSTHEGGMGYTGSQEGRYCWKALFSDGEEPFWVNLAESNGGRRRHWLSFSVTPCPSIIKLHHDTETALNHVVVYRLWTTGTAVSRCN